MKTINNQLAPMAPEKAEFIVQRCEGVILSLINDRELLQKKAHFLLGLIGGVATLAIGFWMDKDAALSEGLRQGLGVEILLLLSLGVLLILTCLMPSNYAIPGGEPNQLLRPEVANQELPWMLVGYCYGLQERIDTNRNRNANTALWLRIVAISLFVSPLASHVLVSLGRSDPSPVQSVEQSSSGLPGRYSVTAPSPPE